MGVHRMNLRPLALAALLAAATPALAQLRTIPAAAKAGVITFVQQPIVRINGQPMRLAPGAQIRNAENTIVLPQAVPPDSPMKYELDSQGMVKRVWLLSPREAAARGSEQN